MKLLHQVAELGRELHERLHSLHEHGYEGPPAAVRERLLDHPPPDRVHPAAPPAPCRKQRLKRRCHAGHEPRPHRHLEVAHAVQIAERAGAVGHARVSGRVASGQFHEDGVECGEVIPERRRISGGDRGEGRLKPPQLVDAPRPHRRVGVRLKSGAQIALGVRPGGDPKLGVERLRQRLHRPRLEVDVAAANESA